MYERLLLLGWDGATWDYIYRFLKQGDLPHLARLLEGGARASLRSTTPCWSNVAWPSLVTGLWPGKTRVYDGLVRQPGKYTARPVNMATFRGIRLWNWVNRFSKSAGVINVPMSYPAAPLEGFLVAGFDSPRGANKIAFPPDLLARWRKRGISYDLLDKLIKLLQEPELDRFTKGCIEITRERGDLVASLWRKEPVDLLFNVFMATDSINHRTHDMTRIAAVYRAADEALGTILQAINDNTLVCLVSDHGSTPAYWYLSLYRLLAKAGWLQFRPEIAPRFWKRLPGKLGPWLSRFWSQLSPMSRRWLSWPWLRLEPRLSCGYENIDWRHTTVYALTPMGPLYLNKKGREPAGVVNETEVETLQEEIVQALQETRDPMSGEPLFAAVLRGEEAFPEASQDDGALPDILFELADYRYHVITGYPTDPLVRPIPDAREYGTHTPEGILVLAGPGVRAGDTLPQADLVDVFPTLMAAWGLPIPREVDGRVLQEAFTTPLKEERVESEQNRVSADTLTPEEADEVTERLRALGYL